MISVVLIRFYFGEVRNSKIEIVFSHSTLWGKNTSGVRTVQMLQVKGQVGSKLLSEKFLIPLACLFVGTGIQDNILYRYLPLIMSWHTSLNSVTSLPYRFVFTSHPSMTSFRTASQNQGIQRSIY